MKTTLIASAAIAAALLTGCGGQDATVTLNGSGATFPDPVYQAWIFTYNRTDSGAKVNYQALGSGAGINQIKEGTVDFAGTDAPLTAKECEEAKLTQFPMLSGAVTPIVNIPGMQANQLKLSDEVLAKIFMGQITKWNDAAIVGINPGVTLPDLSITVVYRSDSSGTTNIFTGYLTKVSPAWATNIGAGKSVKWPTGLGGQKNPGVCNLVAQTQGAIGYTEYTYAVEAKLTTVQMQSKDGKWQNAGTDAWPLVGTTYLLVRDDIAADKKAALQKYVTWCYSKSGADLAHDLHYTPLTVEAAKQDTFWLGTMKADFLK